MREAEVSPWWMHLMYDLHRCEHKQVLKTSILGHTFVPIFLWHCWLFCGQVRKQMRSWQYRELLPAHFLGPFLWWMAPLECNPWAVTAAAAPALQPSTPPCQTKHWYFLLQIVFLLRKHSHVVFTRPVGQFTCTLAAHWDELCP